MTVSLRVYTISGNPDEDHIGFPLSCFHRGVYVPLPEVASLEPTDIFVISHGVSGRVRRLVPFAPFELPSPHYAPVVVRRNLEVTRTGVRP